MTDDVWEIDVDEMTLDDLEVLEQGIGPGSSVAQVKAVLGRLVTNKTPEEIGKIPLRDLRRHLDKLGQTVAELAIPKESATP